MREKIDGPASPEDALEDLELLRKEICDTHCGIPAFEQEGHDFWCTVLSSSIAALSQGPKERGEGKVDGKQGSPLRKVVEQILRRWDEFSEFSTDDIGRLREALMEEQGKPATPNPEDK